ncbi:hypothetical protein K737_300315 [Holospora undulata HU1]|uniref:Uncharacterized protein n=1 Tax=Holospora undulata HU1 TaxID=1321371 RepID=A0A061JIW0_9PROT|nr:hypothetical protein K737_300315 [Holospora undulata HU1]
MDETPIRQLTYKVQKKTDKAANQGIDGGKMSKSVNFVVSRIPKDIFCMSRTALTSWVKRQQNVRKKVGLIMDDKECKQEVD